VALDAPPEELDGACAVAAKQVQLGERDPRQVGAQPTVAV